MRCARPGPGDIEAGRRRQPPGGVPKLGAPQRAQLSAISLTGELYLAMPDHPYKGPDVVRFLEQLPGYAPELNPDEGVWRYLKRVELKNVVCADLGELRREFWAAVGRLRAKPDVLRACVREVGYV